MTLVGHSFNDLAITPAGEAVPELIDHLVYLTAYVPAKAPSGAALAEFPEGNSSILIGDPQTTGAMRINPRNADPDYLEKGRQALYNDVSTEEYVNIATRTCRYQWRLRTPGGRRRDGGRFHGPSFAAPRTT